MLLVAYDFQNDKKRTKFAKFLKKYGYRIQYSIFTIKNSKRVLQNILKEIELKYQKDFSGTDSIIIFSICEGCEKKITRYGYAKNEDVEVFFLEWSLTIFPTQSVSLCGDILKNPKPQSLFFKDGYK